MWRFYSRFVLFIKSISDASKTYWNFGPNRLYLILAFVLQLFLWWWSKSIYNQLADDFFIFHYTVDFGVDLVGAPNLIFILPGLALFFTLINLILAISMVNKKSTKLLWHLFGIGSILVNLFVSLALLAIYLINLA